MRRVGRDIEAICWKLGAVLQGAHVQALEPIIRGIGAIVQNSEFRVEGSGFRLPVSMETKTGLHKWSHSLGGGLKSNL